MSVYKETDFTILYFSNIQEKNSCSNCRIQQATTVHRALEIHELVLYDVQVKPPLKYALSNRFASTWSVRKVSDRIFLCEHLMDYNLARLHEPTLNLSAHA